MIEWCIISSHLGQRPSMGGKERDQKAISRQGKSQYGLRCHIFPFPLFVSFLVVPQYPSSPFLHLDRFHVYVLFSPSLLLLC